VGSLILGKNIGIIVVIVVAAIAALILSSGQPRVGSAPEALARSIQTLKVIQTEMYQSELRFVQTNAEAVPMLGGAARLGRIEGAGPVTEMNLREGGVIEFLLDRKDKDGQRLRVIMLPQIPDGMGNMQWQCVSANWKYAAGMGTGCRFDPAAGQIERDHLAALRATAAKVEKDAEDARAKQAAEQANVHVERERERSVREAERNREE
jgi:hypothetical protein